MVLKSDASCTCGVVPEQLWRRAVIFDEYIPDCKQPFMKREKKNNTTITCSLVAPVPESK